ncbi:MAG: class I adenylate-forming enzyme family protein [Actinomycetes bacterium]
MLDQTVREAARRFGAAPALVTDDRTLSYAELDVVASQRAAALAQLGVGEGHVAALVMPAGVEYVATYLALARLGAVTAGISDRFAEAERNNVLDRLQPDLVLGLEDVGRLPTSDREPPTPPYDDERPVAIVFTSGTTGTPRGATFCGKQLLAITAMDVGTTWGGGDPVVVSTGLPHVGFMTKLPGHLQRGSRMHVLQRWRASDVLRTVVDNRIPVIGAVAAQVALLMRLPEFETTDLSCVRALIVGAGPSPADLVREASTRFNAAYSIRYSSTESGGLGTMTAFDAPDEEALHTVGRPRPGTELRIDDGEICLRGAHVMAGYWRDDAATGRVLRSDWLHTGDLGHIDEQGCLRLTGRKSDVYIRGGYNVHPAEVEAVLRAHPDIADVAVVPRPDPVMGEVGVAVVVPKTPGDPPTLHSLRNYGARYLAAYKLPEAVRVVDGLPLTPMDKVDRRGLTDYERSRNT